MKQEEKTLESLISGGLIGAALGALLSNSKQGATLGAIAGAAILASIRASKNALKTNIPVLIEENNDLYEVSRNGKKKFIKHLPKQKELPNKNFTLK